MTGALNLEPGFFEGNILVNLDSEDEGILFIGCAGGTDSIGTFRYLTTVCPDDYKTFEIAITGLTGGHSGDEIHKELGNSIKLMSRLLTTVDESCNAMVAAFNGGNLRNAIPREAFATIVVPTENESKLKLETEAFLKLAGKEFGLTDPGLSITISEKKLAGEVMNLSDSRRLLEMLNACPHGVLAWSEEMKGLVETSTNLASVKFRQNNTIEVVTTQRSSKESGKKYASSLVESIMVPAGVSVTHSDGYPGWTPNLNSPILKATTETYKALFNTDPEVMAIHAGLECGIFYEKFPGIDMISFGPTIKGAHTPEERINIESVLRFWKLLTVLLEKVPEKQ
jgi:dipeptidase D